MTFLFRKYVKVKILRSHNEVIGFLFLAIASFYALLLSFIVLVVWDLKIFTLTYLRKRKVINNPNKAPNSTIKMKNNTEGICNI